MVGSPETEHEREAQRILRQVRFDSGTQTSARLDAAPTLPRATEDANDRIEQLGKLIAALILLVGLFVLIAS